MYCLQGAAKVSILMIGQQAIMDAYLCLLHLTAGILVGEYCDLHNLFALCSLTSIVTSANKLKYDQVGFQLFLFKNLCLCGLYLVIFSSIFSPLLVSQYIILKTWSKLEKFGIRQS